MPQKYKVFLETQYIVFANQDQGVPEWKGTFPSTYEILAEKLRTNGNFQLISANPTQSMHSFFAAFKYLQTAGALVRQKEKDAYLWINRFDHLDLPKGKIEDGESEQEAAIREVREETGLIGVLERGPKIGSTFHVYPHKSGSVFKENHWFELSYEGSLLTQPQLEEGILAVFWLSKSEWEARLDETYPAICELLQVPC